MQTSLNAYQQYHINQMGPVERHTFIVLCWQICLLIIYTKLLILFFCLCVALKLLQDTMSHSCLTQSIKSN